MRICPNCGGGLEQGDGFEKSASERGGNPRSLDEFHCRGCGRTYSHSYDERFDGDIENWWVSRPGSDDWAILEPKDWPTLRWPEPKPEPKPEPEPEPAKLDRVIYLRHFNYQAVLEYDTETGEQTERSNEQMADDTRYWRGFYMPDGPHSHGVYATPDGPVFFLDEKQVLLRRGLSQITVEQLRTRREFCLEHGGNEILTLQYKPPPSGFDAWSQDETIVDFYKWLEAGVADPKWHAFLTVKPGEDVTSVRERSEEGETGKFFGQYLLVYDYEKGEFPVRMRVLTPGQDESEFYDRIWWTGTTTLDASSRVLASLRERYLPPRYLALAEHGNDWPEAERKFRRVFVAD